jgi:arylsulfate sulfotransferase
MPRLLQPVCLAILVMLAFCGCDQTEEELPIPDPPDFECQLHVSDSNIVVSVLEEQDSMIFLLENDQRIARSNGCFKSINVDASNWRVDIIHENNTLQSIPFLGNSLLIAKDSILLNPYGSAPLAALVKFTLPVRGRIMLTVHGIDEESPDITNTFDGFEYHHSIQVFGLYVDHENSVTLSVLDFFGNERISRDITIRTGPAGTIESGQMNVIVNEYTGNQKNRLFMANNAIFDPEGYVRWYSKLRGEKYYPIANGLIAIQLWGDRGNAVTAFEDIRIINMMGQQRNLLDVPNRLHHEINEKTPGGNLLVATNAQPYIDNSTDTEDMIAEINPITRAVVKTWDLREIFDPTRERLKTEKPNDWCHLNSIEYDSTDNTLLISSKLQYFVSKIDYETGAIKWIFGNHENWKESWRKYLLTPTNFDTLVEPDQDWVYAQHMPRLTKDGNVIVYDNGRNRPGVDFCRIHEFRVNETNMTVEKIWTHDFPYSTGSMGSVQVFEDGNVLVGHGARGEIIEVTRENVVVFEAKLGKYYRTYPMQFY